MEEINHATVIGKHEEKLSNLEKGQCDLKNDMLEIKSDLKDLIVALREYIEKEHEDTNEQLKTLTKELTLVKLVVTKQQVRVDDLEEFKEKVLMIAAWAIKSTVFAILIGAGYKILAHVFGF